MLLSVFGPLPANWTVEDGRSASGPDFALAPGAAASGAVGG
jgi:hypothetical protein